RAPPTIASSVRAVTEDGAVHRAPGAVIPVAVSGLSAGVKAVTVGTYHSCALTTTGGVKCWGINGSGELGGSRAPKSPVRVEGKDRGSGIKAISAGASHTCAVTTAGAVRCWGWNSYGQLGNNSTMTSFVPVEVSGLGAGVADVSAGMNFTCTRSVAGRVQ